MRSQEELPKTRRVRQPYLTPGPFRWRDYLTIPSCSSHVPDASSAAGAGARPLQLPPQHDDESRASKPRFPRRFPVRFWRFSSWLPLALRGVCRCDYASSIISWVKPFARPGCCRGTPRPRILGVPRQPSILSFSINGERSLWLGFSWHNGISLGKTKVQVNARWLNSCTRCTAPARRWATR